MMDDWIDARLDSCEGKLTNGRMRVCNVALDARMYVYVYGWLVGWLVDGRGLWTSGLMDEQPESCLCNNL